MIGGIVERWRRFWGLPWLWKGPILAGVGLVVLIIGLFIAVAGGDGGTGTGTGNLAQASPTVTASRSPRASPVTGPSGAASPTPKPTSTPTENSQPTSAVAVPPPVEPPPENAPPLGLLVPPAPSPPPPPEPGLSPEQQATLDQFAYCADAWWNGAKVEIQLAIASGASRTTLEEQHQAYMNYLLENCVGIGARAAAIPGIPEAWCPDIKKSATTITLWTQVAQLLRSSDTSSLEFARKEVDEFIATARC